MLLHASTIAIENSAVMLIGEPGAGKSDLALRLIDDGAMLIADDQTLLTRNGERLLASAPESIQGLIEVRHVGLLRLPYQLAAPVALVIDLAALGDNIERLPEDEHVIYLDVRVRKLRLPAFAASTSAKIRMALSYL